jgi:exonuclease III
MREISFKTQFFGSVTAVEVEIFPFFKLVVVSLYSILERIGSTFYSIPNLHRIFSDLTGILEGKYTRDRIILGGDFNASLQWDSRQAVKSHHVFFDRLKEYGLHNCFNGYYTDFVQTLRSPKSLVPWQSDYIFVSDALVPYLKSCSVLDNEMVRGLSDHNPVVIELEIPTDAHNVNQLKEVNREISSDRSKKKAMLKELWDKL